MNSLYTNMGRMDTLFNQMNTLKKIQRPSDDPIIAGRSLKLRINVMETEQHKNNVDEAKAWMDVTEAVLSNMTQILKEIRTKCNQASNGTLTPDDKDKIVQDIQQLYKQLQQESNVTYAGRYVFSGYKTDQPVYLDKDKVLDKSSILANGMTLDRDMNLDANAILKQGSILRQDITTGSDIVFSGDTKLASDMELTNDMVLANEMTLDQEITLDTPMILTKPIHDKDGNELHPAGTIPAGTVLPKGAKIAAGETLPAGQTLPKGQTLKAGETLPAGQVLPADQPLPIDITLAAGETIVNGAQIAAGSVFEGKVVLEGNINLSEEVTLPAGMIPTVDIRLPDGTTLPAGTALPADTKLPAGTQLPKGTFLPVGTTLPKGTLNPEVLGKINGQELKYEIGVGTTLDVNSLGLPELMSQIGGDIESIIAALNANPPLSDEELTKVFSDMLETVDTRSSKVSEMTASLGSRQKRLEYTETRLIDDKTNLTELLSKTEDVDLEDTYVEFNTQYMIYQSALQATSKVIMANLGDFLR